MKTGELVFMNPNKSPWITIWTKPQETIRAIVSENPKRSIWILAWIYGFLSLVNGFQSFSLGTASHFLILLLVAVILAPFWGMVLFGVWSWVVLWVGKILGGQGTFLSVRAAFAWSCVPLMLNVGLWLFVIFLFGSSMFQMMQPQEGVVMVLFLVFLAKIAMLVWALVIYINGLAEVQQFSIAKAIGNIVLSWLAIAVVVLLIWFGLGLVMQMQSTAIT